MLVEKNGNVVMSVKQHNDSVRMDVARRSVLSSPASRRDAQ